MRLDAKSVSCSVGAARILDSVDLAAEASSLTVIIGPNGAGKSTLLRLMAGLRRPTAGSISLDGQSIDEIPLLELARLRSYLAPDPPGFIDFTVQQVVSMGRHPWQSTSADTESAVLRAMLATDISHLATKPHSTLSTGEARRTQLARALAQEAPLMILDEPINGLDVAYSELVIDEIRARSEEGSAVIAVLHDLTAAAQHADQVIVLDQGRVIAAGTPEDVMTETTLSDVYRHPIRVVPHPDRPGLAIVPGRKVFE